MGYLPVLQGVQPDSTLALQAVTVSPTLRTDGDSPAGTTGSPVTRYQSGWYSTTGAPVGVCSLNPALRAVFLYLTAGQDDQRTGPLSDSLPMLTQPIVLQRCLAYFNARARSVNRSMENRL